MKYSTTVEWDPTFGQDQFDIISIKVTEMITDEKTDGSVSNAWPNGVSIPPGISRRRWKTLAAAEEWGNFLSTLDIPPKTVAVFCQEQDAVTKKPTWVYIKHIIPADEPTPVV